MIDLKTLMEEKALLKSEFDKLNAEIKKHVLASRLMRLEKSEKDII